MKIKKLTSAQVTQINALNKSSGAIVVICDHGEGPCVTMDDLSAPAFAEHKTLIESFAIADTEIDDGVEQLRAELAAEKEKVRKLEIDLSDVIRQRDAKDAELAAGKTK